MDQPNLTFTKILILDTENFEQWKFRIQQYLQNEDYALWEVIEFGDSYEAPLEESGTGSTSESSAKKKGRTVAITTEDMQKRRNDTIGGNEATKKTKKNQLKQQYSNFKAEGLEILEQTFNKLQAILSHLEFMDIEIKRDDLNQKFFTSLAQEWLIGKGEVNTASIPTASTQVSPASADVAAASISHDTVCAYIASQSNGSQIKYKDINQIDEDDIEEMDIKWNMALLSMRADRFWKKTGKRLPYKECRTPRSQDRGRRENYKQGSKEVEPAPKALMAIDGVGWDWSYMANEKENHALVADDEAPTEFALMAKSSSSSENEVFDDSLCSKSCKKNTDSLNTKITNLDEALSDNKTNLYHYKLGLSQVEARLVEFKTQEIKFCEKIRGLEFDVKNKNTKIENLMNELEQIKKGKEGLDSKLTGFESASKDLDTLLGSQRFDKNKEGLGYSAVPPSCSWKSWPKNNYTHKSMSPRTVVHKSGRTPIRTNRTNMNVAQPRRTSFAKTTHSYVKRPFQEKSAVRTQFRVPRVPTVNKNFPTVDTKFSTVKSTFTAGLGNKGKAVKASAFWIWRPKQNTIDKGLNSNSVSVIFKKYQYFDTQGRLKLAFGDYHNMISILEKLEHNINFHQIVDFVEASHLRYALTINPAVYVSHIRQCWSTARIEQRIKEPRFSPLLMGEGSGTLTEPHHTPSPEAQQSPHHDLSSSLHPTETTKTIPTETPTEIAALRQYSRRVTQIAQSRALPIAVDKPASITSALPHDSTPRVTSLDADEGSMQQQLQELTNLCTHLLRQQTEMATKIAAQDLEISNLKAWIKLFENRDKGTAELSRDDAPIKERKLVNVLTSMDAVNILTSGVQDVSVPYVAEVSTVVVSTGSGLVPTVSAIFTTASMVTPYSKCPREISAKDKGKEKMVESDTPKKKKLQEQINVQMAREIEEQMAREDQRMDEQIARDAKIARIHAEEELKMLIDGLDRNNEVIGKHLQEYE
nr:hypothetical protein [Tanacetum cinerariifolium]